MDFTRRNEKLLQWCAAAAIGLAWAYTADANPESGPPPADGHLHASDTDPRPRWQRDPEPACDTETREVRLASPEIAQVVGFEFAQVQAAPLEHVLERNVEVMYNANRYARLSSRAPGVIYEVPKDLGVSIRKDDTLIIVESSEIGAAKSELLQAREMSRLWQANAERERTLVGQGVGVQREALEAETKAAETRIELNKARQRLRNLGLTAAQIELVEKDGETLPFLEVRTPFDGLIVERSAALGEYVEAGKPLVAVADTSMMWARVDLLEADLAVVRVGQKATVHLDGLPGKEFAGAITWISTQINERTRTAEARIELANPDGLLRAHMFGHAQLSITAVRQAVTVPKQAVQWEGCCNVAFVQSDDLGLKFRPSRLTLGYDAGDSYEVLEGLVAGDVVVTKGSFILKNEIRKDAVGTGCCEVGHLK